MHASAPRVVVVGSINVDLVVRVPRLPAPGETVTGGSFERHGGGKGANQAVAAARAGADVHLIGAVGDDELGDAAVAELAAEGIDVSGVSRLPGVPTGVAAILVDEAGENQIGVASGANWALDPESVARAVEAIPRAQGPAAVCLISFEVPDPVVVAAATAAADEGMPILVSPAPARPLPEGLLPLGPVLTPNRGELASLTGDDDVEAGARRLAALTGDPVVVTLGAQGALLVAGDEVALVPAHRVEAVDTTGAGDTFTGVLASELARGAHPQVAVARASAAAALSVTARGARSAPTRDAVDAFLRAQGPPDPHA